MATLPFVAAACVAMVGAGPGLLAEGREPGTVRGLAAPESHEASIRAAVARLARHESIPEREDLVTLASAGLDLWLGRLPTDQYVDMLAARGGDAYAMAVGRAEQRRSHHPERYPADDAWQQFSDVEKVRAYLRDAWLEYPPAVWFDAANSEMWMGLGIDSTRPAPSPIIDTQGSIAIWRSDAMTNAQLQEGECVWLRVPARLNGFHGEHVIDLRFVFEPSSKRWFAAEVRVHGEPTKFGWAI